jgi:hypothetical protein
MLKGGRAVARNIAAPAGERADVPGLRRFEARHRAGSNSNSSRSAGTPDAVAIVISVWAVEDAA